MTDPTTSAADAALPNLDEVDGFDDKNVKISAFDKYAGRAPYTDRLAIISEKITRSFVHFHQNKGFRCLSTPDNPAICCTTLGAPEQKFGLVLFHYITDENGALVDDSRCSGKVKIWIFSESKFTQLKGLAAQWPLLDKGAGEEQIDLLVKCDDDKWQRLTMTPTRAAHWKVKEAWHKAVAASRDKATVNLQKLIGKVRDEAEVKEVLGISTPLAQTGGGAGEVDLSDVLEED